MKKLYSLAAVLLLSITAFASIDNLPVKAVDAQGDKGQTKYNISYIYNSKNQLIWELTEGSTRQVHEYNELGQCVKITTYNWIPAELVFRNGTVTEMEYDENGHISKKTEKKPNYTGTIDTNVYTYKKYDHDIAVEYSLLEQKSNGKEYKYDYKVTLDLDEKDRVIKSWTSEFDYDYPEDGFCGKMTVESTYDEKDRVSSNTTLKYDYDFNKPKTATKSVITYTYAELDSKYVPNNLKAEVKDGNVKFSWDVVEGASKYILSYDLERIEVEGTSYEAILATGDRQFTVQAVVDGIERNGADPVTASIYDPGKLPVNNLEVSKMEKIIVDTESAELDKRELYKISLKWDMPEGHSVVTGFNIYYNSKTYGNDCRVGCTDPEATTFDLLVDPFEVTEWDEQGTPYKGINTPIYVTVKYVTGESEKSNVIYVNPWDEIETGIVDVTATANNKNAVKVRKVISDNSIKIINAAKAYSVGGHEL